MSESAETWVQATKLSIAVDHPSAEGHFPGRPVVPAVVLLNRIIDLVRERCDRSFDIVIEQAKFQSPLCFGEEASASLSFAGSKLRFKVNADDRPIAQGTMRLRPESIDSLAGRVNPV